MRTDHIHRNTGFVYGPITFIINKNKSRTKVVGTAKCGFRGFAYIDRSQSSIADAKRAIVTEYNDKRKKNA